MLDTLLILLDRKQQEDLRIRDTIVGRDVILDLSPFVRHPAGEEITGLVKHRIDDAFRQHPQPEDIALEEHAGVHGLVPGLDRL